MVSPLVIVSRETHGQTEVLAHGAAGANKLGSFSLFRERKEIGCGWKLAAAVLKAIVCSVKTVGGIELKKVEQSKKIFVKVINTVVAIVMISMVLMIFVNAVLRYVFNTGIPQTEELSRWAFVWVSALGAILAYYNDKHVGVNMLVEKLHGLPRLIIQMVSEILVMLALGVLLVGGWRYFLKTAHLDSAALPLPMGIITITALAMALAMFPKVVLEGKKHIDEYRGYLQKKGESEVHSK